MTEPRIWYKYLQNSKEYPWFDWIACGKKTKECRIHRDDWKLVNIGDIIMFNEPTSNRTIKTFVTDITWFRTYGEAYEFWGKYMVPIKGVTVDAVNKIYNEIYLTKNDITDVGQHGVVVLGIEIF